MNPLGNNRAPSLPVSSQCIWTTAFEGAQPCHYPAFITGCMGLYLEPGLCPWHHQSFGPVHIPFTVFRLIKPIRGDAQRQWGQGMPQHSFPLPHILGRKEAPQALGTGCTGQLLWPPDAQASPFCCSRFLKAAALGKLNHQPKLTSMHFSISLLKDLIYLLVGLEPTAPQKVKCFRADRCKCWL